MNNDSKITGDFLAAIQEYADKQKQQIENEVEEFKQAELKKTEEESLAEAYELIQKEIAQNRTLIKTELARKEHESRAQLFKLRAEMTDKVFEGAREKLIAFTDSYQYGPKLLQGAARLAELFGKYPCVICVRERDLRFTSEISALFKTVPRIIADHSIKIGGIKGRCKALSITADETLDTLLEAQHEWFIRNSTLKII